MTLFLQGKNHGGCKTKHSEKEEKRVESNSKQNVLLEATHRSSFYPKAPVKLIFLKVLLSNESDSAIVVVSPRPPMFPKCHELKTLYQLKYFDIFGQLGILFGRLWIHYVCVLKEADLYL